MVPGEKITRAEALRWMAGIFEEPVENVRADTPRDAIKAWDSLGILSLMAGLDERFDVRLTETELPGLKSVRDVLNILEKKGCLVGE